MCGIAGVLRLNGPTDDRSTVEAMLASMRRRGPDGVVVEGDCDPKLGWVMDYADITKAFKPFWEKLDHHYLNEVPGLDNPTSENIAVWIWNKLKPKLPSLIEVVVAETCTARCIYRGGPHAV